MAGEDEREGAVEMQSVPAAGTDNRPPQVVQQPLQTQQLMDVVIPEGVGPGQQFMVVTPHGTQLAVHCPAHASSGSTIQVVNPDAPQDQRLTAVV